MTERLSAIMDTLDEFVRHDPCLTTPTAVVCDAIRQRLLAVFPEARTVDAPKWQWQETTTGERLPVAFGDLSVFCPNCDCADELYLRVPAVTEFHLESDFNRSGTVTAIMGDSILQPLADPGATIMCLNCEVNLCWPSWFDPTQPSQLVAPTHT